MVKDSNLHETSENEEFSRSGTLAVIDIGATSLRLVVAQSVADGEPHILEALQQSVTLGKDTFTKGSIGREAIENCVKGLLSFLQVLSEYQIDPRGGNVRVIATSAVREADNRQTFLDRIYIATGLEVRVVENTEIARFTYLGIKRVFDESPFRKDRTVVVVEIGGGGTELIAIRNRKVVFSQAHRFGSLRVRQELEERHSHVSGIHGVIEIQMARAAESLRNGIAEISGKPALVGIGGDARFVANLLNPDWDGEGTVRISTSAWGKLAAQLVDLSEDELVHRYHLTYPEAETLVPALLAYARLAEQLDLRNIYVSSRNVRDGVLREMLSHSAWIGQFTSQIINSALNLGGHYQVDLPHAQHVAKIARKLFGFLQEQHNLSPRYELLLTLAAILHEVGMFISTTSHHKHSQYIIENSEIFGLGKRDVAIIALVARYHRRGGPKPTHSGYANLERDERVAVSKLAAILRIADALERGHKQRLQHLDFELEGDTLIIHAGNVPDISYERIALEEKRQLFEQVYGLGVLLTKSQKQD